MTRRGIKAAGVLVLAGMLCVASAARADHGDDHHEHGHAHWHHHYEHHGDWHHHDYDVHSYAYRSGYYGPQVYVPAPPPPSFGLNLVFPIH
jgi:hypothetical protein